MVILFGLLLVIVFIGVIIYFFSAKRKDQVEQVKYDILDEYKDSDEAESEDSDNS